MATEINTKRVVTPLARLSYPYLFQPSKPMQEGGEAKYQCELIFEPGADMSELHRAAFEALREKFSGKLPKDVNLKAWLEGKYKSFKSPFRSGDDDREDKDGYEGRIFIGARSKDKPGVVAGRDRVPVTDESDVYGGCWVKASVTAFGYDTSGNKGVSFALNNVWKVRDGEPFGSKRSAEEEFGSEEVDEDAFGESDEDSLY